MRLALATAVVLCVSSVVVAGSTTVAKEASPLNYLGYLEFNQWLTLKPDLTGFSLVRAVGDLSLPPSKWNIRTDDWQADGDYLQRLKASVLDSTFTEGHLTIDPTRYLAFRFPDGSCYLVEVAGIKLQQRGVMIFKDGFAELTDDFRTLIEQAYDVESFTTYE